MGYSGPQITWQYLHWLLLESPEGFSASLFVLLNLILILVIRAVVFRQTMPLTQITIPLFFLLLYCTIFLPPSVIFYVESTHFSGLDVFLAIQAVPHLFLLGVWFAGAIRPKNPGAVANFLDRNQPLKVPANEVSHSISCVFLLVAAAILVLYFVTASYIPLIGALSSYGAASSDAVRFSIYESPPAIIFLYALATRFLIPYALVSTFLLWRVEGKKRLPRLLGTFALALAASVLTFERQHALALFALLAIAIYFSGQKLLSLKIWVYLIGLVCLAGIAGGLVSRAQYNTSIDVGQLLGYGAFFLMMRVWIDPAFMTFAVIEKLGDSPYLLFSCSRFGPLFGVECTSGNVATTAIGFVADFWINGGWAALIAGSVCYGFFFQWVQVRFFNQRSISHITLYALFLLNAVWLFYGNVFSTMVLVVFGGGMALLYCLEKAGVVTSFRLSRESIA